LFLWQGGGDDATAKERITVAKLGSCALFLDRAGGTFCLGSCAIDTEIGATVSYGALRRLSAQEMELVGLSIIMEDLAKFKRRRKTEKSELESMELKQRNKFFRSHRYVSLWLESSEVMMMAPMHRQPRGGFVGEPGEIVRITLPVSQEEFYALLLKTLERCK
jgi:hypothetical protein